MAVTLSKDEGLLWLANPRAGAYRLQAERLGYQTTTGPELYVMRGDTPGVDFHLSVGTILLGLGLFFIP